MNKLCLLIVSSILTKMITLDLDLREKQKAFQAKGKLQAKAS